MSNSSNNGNKPVPPCTFKGEYNGVKGCNDTSLLRIRGLCRMHFIAEHIEKLTRAEKYYLKELDQTQSAKKKLLAELSVAEQVHVSHDLRLLCHKCGVVTMQGYMALQQHELYCTGRSGGRTVVKGVKKPRAAKVTVDLDDDDEEMTDTE